MSWKKRRQFAYGRPDPKWARWSNLFTVISLAITLSGLYLYKLPIIGGLIALLWGISLVSTPWLILMGWASSLWNYGFPKFKEEPKENFMDLIKNRVVFQSTRVLLSFIVTFMYQ